MDKPDQICEKISVDVLILPEGWIQEIQRIKSEVRIMGAINFHWFQPSCKADITRHTSQLACGGLGHGQ